MSIHEIIIAIDPGVSGATAVQYPDGKVVVFPFESESEQKELVKSLVISSVVEQVPIRAIIEEVGGFVGKAQPGSAMFNFGRNFGFHIGLLMANDIPVRFLRPQSWQRGLPKTPKLADKAAAKRQHKRDLRDTAARIFPSINVTLKNADALLILDYAITILTTPLTGEKK